VGAGVTKDEKLDALRRLMAIQKAIRSIADSSTDAAEVALAANATGLAFSLLMVRESLLSYGKEVSKWSAAHLK